MSLLTSLINFVIHALASNRKYYTLTHQQCSLTVEIIEWVKVLRSVQVLWQMRIYYLLAHTYLILLLGHNKMLHWLWTLDSAVFHFVWIFFLNLLPLTINTAYRHSPEVRAISGQLWNVGSHLLTRKITFNFSFQYFKISDDIR